MALADQNSLSEANEELQRLEKQEFFLTCDQIALMFRELRTKFFCEGDCVDEGSKLDAKIKNAEKRAHRISAENNLHSLETKNIPYEDDVVAYIQDDIRKNYAAAGTPVEENSDINQRIKSAGIKTNALFAQHVQSKLNDRNIEVKSANGLSLKQHSAKFLGGFISGAIDSAIVGGLGYGVAGVNGAKGALAASALHGSYDALENSGKGKKGVLTVLAGYFSGLASSCALITHLAGTQPNEAPTAPIQNSPAVEQQKPAAALPTGASVHQSTSGNVVIPAGLAVS